MIAADKTAWLLRQDINPASIGRMLTDCVRSNGLPTQAQLDAARNASAAAMRSVRGKVAVLNVTGMIERKMSAWGYFMGSFALDAGEAALAQLLAARDVEAIVLAIDSPGGASYGVEEFAAQVRAARDVKPIYAIADPMAASAAYWIASAATQVIVTPSGDVGSIGVYLMHVDYSAALEEAGIKVSVIRSGKFKAEGNPYEPLTQDAQDHLQEMVDETHTKFVKAVAAYRGVSVSTVREKFGQGRLLSAQQAVDVGAADKVLSFGQLLAKLGGQPELARTQDRRASAEIMRHRLALTREREAAYGDAR